MCRSDFDCTGNLICTPSIAAWAPAGANATFCGCDVMRAGFIKETPMATSCDGYGPQTVYLLLISSLVFVIGGGMQLHFMMVIAVLKRQKQLIMNDIMITLLLLNGANTLELIGNALRIIQYLEPAEHIYEANGNKAHSLYTSSFAVTLLAQSLGLFAYSNLPLVWAEVVFRTQKFRHAGDSAWRLRFGVRFYQVLVLISRIVPFAITGMAAVTFTSAVAILGLFGVVVIFVVSRRWFVKLFKRVAGKSNGSSVILKRINILTDIVVIGMGMSTVTITVYVVYSANGELFRCQEGTLCTVHLWREACSLGVVAVKLACQYYCALCLGFHGCSFVDSSNDKSAAQGSAHVSTTKLSSGGNPEVQNSTATETML